MFRKTALLLLAVLGAMAVMAVAASADTTVTATQRLHVQIDPNQSGCLTAGSTAAWVTGNDAPGDTNSKLFDVNVGSGGCVVAYSNQSYQRRTAVGNQKNLSYDVSTSSSGITGAGQFYMAIEFGNGDVAYLDPFYCHNPIAVSSGSWDRSDFTGATANCAFYVTGSTGDLYTATGTMSAWSVYATANPTQEVVHRYMVFSFSHNQIDRLSLGVGKMYTRGNNVAVSCTTEASC
jgi:hypothetical protein